MQPVLKLHFFPTSILVIDIFMHANDTSYTVNFFFFIFLTKMTDASDLVCREKLKSTLRNIWAGCESWKVHISFPFLEGVLTTTLIIFTDEFEDESDTAEPSEDNEDREDSFLRSYSDAMNEELKTTSLTKSFVRANEQAPKKDEVHFCSARMWWNNFTL